MTVRQQIEVLIFDGLRNCEIYRQLQCDPAYICKVRKAVGVANKTARVQRMPEVAAMFAQGKTDDEIAAHFGISASSVRPIRRMCKLKRTVRTGRPSKFDREGIAKAYAAGEKTSYISAVFGCHESTPSKIAAAMGLPKRRPGNNKDVKAAVSVNMDKPAKILAAELGTTAGYINKVKCRIRNGK